MNTITVKWQYCLEHFRRHVTDERGQCIAESPDELTRKGYVYLGHIGGGWYRYRAPSQPNPLPLDWQMALDERADTLAMQDEPDF
jgi:hypothetical protein